MMDFHRAPLLVLGSTESLCYLAQSLVAVVDRDIHASLYMVSDRQTEPKTHIGSGVKAGLVCYDISRGESKTLDLFRSEGVSTLGSPCLCLVRRTLAEQLGSRSKMRRLCHGRSIIQLSVEHEIYGYPKTPLRSLLPSSLRLSLRRSWDARRKETAVKGEED